MNENTEKMLEKIARLQVKVQDAAGATSDTVKDYLSDAKGELARTQENFRLSAERSKSKLSAKLLESQMSIRSYREDLSKEIAEKKFDTEKSRLETEVISARKAAALLSDYAEEIVDEAAVAKLDAEKLAKEYEEKYGEKI